MVKVVSKRVSKKDEPIYTLVLDMNNIMKISFRNDMSNNDGKNYGMIITALRIIGDVLRKKDFNYCVAAYDGIGSGVLRWQIYKDYKANRGKNYELHDPNMTDYDRNLEEFRRLVLSKKTKKTEKDIEEEKFESQMLLLQNIMEELCIRQYMYENVEGDDIISYCVKRRLPNEKIVIVSSDKDICQLISDNVIIWNPRIKEFVTKENAIEKIGIIPENIVLQKIICGDTSDNIKGIKGVGDVSLKKTFPEIINEKVDLKTVIERSRALLDRRKEEKKKPLKMLENIVNGVTDGCQGSMIYEINRKIIDLSEPMLTDEARKELDEVYREPLDTSDRSVSNIYKIVSKERLDIIMDETRFGELFGPFGRITMMEKKRFESKGK